MKYFGLPFCPHCKKGMNVFRIWAVRKKGEYLCPRCKRISNIYLSPLIYIFAVLAVASGFLIYFFSQIVWDNVDMMTTVWVLLPFVGFYFLSLFMVYLRKPIIKKIRKTSDGRYFDENDNELKMRMGKLVPVAPNKNIRNINETQKRKDLISSTFEFENESSNSNDLGKTTQIETVNKTTVNQRQRTTVNRENRVNTSNNTQRRNQRPVRQTQMIKEELNFEDLNSSKEKPVTENIQNLGNTVSFDKKEIQNKTETQSKKSQDLLDIFGDADSILSDTKDEN